jgi:hypothetical protein
LVQPCGWCIIWLHDAPATEDRILVVSRHPEGNPYRFAVWRVQGNRRGREVRVVTRYELD